MNQKLMSTQSDELDKAMDVLNAFKRKDKSDKPTVNNLERIIADHNKAIRTDIASEMVGGSRSKAITDVITSKALLAWREQYQEEQIKFLKRLKLEFDVVISDHAGEKWSESDAADMVNKRIAELSKDTK